MNPMYRAKNVYHTLDERYLTEHHINARHEEFKQLYSIIGQLYARTGPISLLDIGVGDARIPLALSSTSAWPHISQYMGIDNSPQCISQAKERLTKYNLDDKVQVSLDDARDLRASQQTYGLIICTYFTAGNFIPPKFSFDDPSKDLDLETNPAFTQVFRSAYDCLEIGGLLVLGSVYLDNEHTQRIQEQFYSGCGMEIITSHDQSFTATKEGFWSQRFTEKQLRDYFFWVNPENMLFTHLDQESFSMMVQVKK